MVCILERSRTKQLLKGFRHQIVWVRARPIIAHLCGTADWYIYL